MYCTTATVNAYSPLGLVSHFCTIEVISLHISQVLNVTYQNEHKIDNVEYKRY